MYAPCIAVSSELDLACAVVRRLLLLLLPFSAGPPALVQAVTALASSVLAPPPAPSGALAHPHGRACAGRADLSPAALFFCSVTDQHV